MSLDTSTTLHEPMVLVDVHTHVYLSRYASLLRSRTSVPRIISQITAGVEAQDRLHILDDEPSGGRPVGPQVSTYRLFDKS